MAVPIVPILVLSGIGIAALMSKKGGGGGGGGIPIEPLPDGHVPPPGQAQPTLPTQPTTPGYVPPPQPSGITTQAQKATSYQAEVIAALSMLHYDPNSNTFSPAPSESAIQYASGLVARMKADGFIAESAALDNIVQAAILVAGKPPTVVAIPAIPPALQTELDAAILYCKDPVKLRAIADALSKLPGAASNAQIQTAIQMLNQLAAQNQAQQQTGSTLQDIDVILTGNTGGVTINMPGAAQANPIPTQTTPVAVPKTPVETAADLMVAHLKRLQIASGDVKKAKGKEDKNIVKKFQGLAKLTSDGKPGPGTLVAAAGHGQYELPLVMYWPTGAKAQKVYDYRAALEALALKLDATDKVAAEQLRASAAREKGQAGIVGPLAT
jgi:hypothetical protein